VNFPLVICTSVLHVFKRRIPNSEAERQSEVTFPAILDKTYSKSLSPILQAATKICHKIDDQIEISDSCIPLVYF